MVIQCPDQHRLDVFLLDHEEEAEPEHSALVADFVVTLRGDALTFLSRSILISYTRTIGAHHMQCVEIASTHGTNRATVIPILIDGTYPSMRSDEAVNTLLSPHDQNYAKLHMGGDLITDRVGSNVLVATKGGKSSLLISWCLVENKLRLLPKAVFTSTYRIHSLMLTGTAFLVEDDKNTDSSDESNTRMGDSACSSTGNDSISSTTSNNNKHYSSNNSDFDDGDIFGNRSTAPLHVLHGTANGVVGFALRKRASPALNWSVVGLFYPVKESDEKQKPLFIESMYRLLPERGDAICLLSDGTLYLYASNSRVFLSVVCASKVKSIDTLIPFQPDEDGFLCLRWTNDALSVGVSPIEALIDRAFIQRKKHCAAIGNTVFELPCRTLLHVAQVESMACGNGLGLLCIAGNRLHVDTLSQNIPFLL